ncbi:hypothetical protein J2S19_004004 [Metabacillus malikii]|uniref:Uncharacterized protein n=1 Tax=Metabacillus malikii TaxID=1504265 RepID=A0ABT9ZK91_9BACI|nr:hypothetical protein [Metabacillus malikii]
MKPILQRQERKKVLHSCNEADFTKARKEKVLHSCNEADFTKARKEKSSS